LKLVPVNPCPIYARRLLRRKQGLGLGLAPRPNILVRRAEEKSGPTQAAFAQSIATPDASLRDWEQGRFAPPGRVVCLLRLSIKHPELTRALSAIRVRRVDGDKEVSCSAVRCSLQRNSSRSSSLKEGFAQLTFLSLGAVAFQRFFGARCQF